MWFRISTIHLMGVCPFQIPIIHSKKLEDKLYLFQFPFSQQTGVDDIKVQKCKLRPENKEVQVQIGISTESSNFDSGIERVDL